MILHQFINLIFILLIVGVSIAIIVIVVVILVFIVSIIIFILHVLPVSFFLLIDIHLLLDLQSDLFDSCSYFLDVHIDTCLVLDESS